MTANIFILISLFIIGACLASFFVCIIDKPNKIFSIRSRSQCDHCKKILGPFNLIPIIAFLIQKGCCSYCNKKLNSYYIITEIFMGLSLPFVWIVSSNQSIEMQTILILIVISFCYLVFLDWQKMLISMPVCLIIFIFSILLWSLESNFSKQLLLLKVLGLIFGFLSLWLINKLYKWIRKREGIGEGDPILFGVIGFFIGLEFLFYVLTISAVCGAIYGLLLIKIKKGDLSDPIPFGSFLCLGTLIIYCIKTLYL